MKAAILPALFLLLTAAPEGVPAQVNPSPDILGIYFDTEALTTVKAYPGYQTFQAYLILTNPTAATGISGWECSIELSAPEVLVKVEENLGPGVNLSSDWDYFVPIGLKSCSLASQPVVLLATFTFFPMNNAPCAVFLHPCSRPSVPGAMIYAADDDPGDFRTLGWSSGNEAEPVAWINVQPPATTVVIDPAPDSIDAPWSLSGPNAYSTSGNGDQTLGGVEPGTYILAWEDVFGWTTPPADTLAVAQGETIIFSGTYLPWATVVVDPEPDSIDAPWSLSGPNAYSTSGNGDQTLGGVEPGTYILVWEDVFGWTTPPPETLAVAANDTIRFAATYIPAGAIVGISDVGNDQGGQVRIVFTRSIFDAAPDTVDVTGYGVYRRQDLYKSTGEPPGAEAGAEKILGWDYLGTVPAHGESYYQCVVPSLCDSTAASGICWSVFFVRTMTPDPLTFFDSAPDSGYSIDNLAPSVPQGLAVDFAAAGNTLSWAENEEPDLQCYCVYRGLREGGGSETGELVQKVAGTNWTDDLGGAPGDPWDFIYWISAVDFGGNESGRTPWADATISGAFDQGPPRQCRLYACCPNPFNPAATIAFDLPDRRSVSLAIYDLTGRRVCTVADRVEFPAGRHELVWLGRNEAGQAVAAGVYLYRMQAGDFREARRMTLLK